MVLDYVNFHKKTTNFYKLVIQKQFLSIIFKFQKFSTQNAVKQLEQRSFRKQINEQWTFEEIARV